MSGWLDIETAPKDGSKVWVRRMHQGRLVTEGWAVFGICHPAAPQLRALGTDPLGRLSADDYAREEEWITASANRKQWLLPDRMYSFPTPTHWKETPDAK
jgi:hypothetical protein